MRNTNETGKYYKGIIPPIITPLTQALELDTEGLNALIAFLVKQGVSGIFVGGTSGEACYLSEPTYQKLCAHTIEQVGGRVPVLLGAIEPSTVRVIERIKMLEQFGAAFFVVTPAFYLQNSTQDEILRHFEAVCASTAGTVAAYNIPGTTHVNILPETAAKLDAFDNILLYKDSCADFEQIQKDAVFLKDTKISLFNGAEELCAASMTFGAQGCVPGLANFFPKLFIDCCEYALTGKLQEARVLQEKIIRVRKCLFFGSHWMAAMKYLSKRMGFGEGGLSLPIEPLTDANIVQIEKLLESEGLS
jgi:4-hydroxy-tetrahydrodipicolinate synthase